MRIPLVLLGLILTLSSAIPAEAQAVVRIGLSVPLTGADAAFGLGLRSGAEQAIADLNRAGPRRYALVVADDSGEPRQAAAVAARFAAESVAVVIGPFESSAVAAALPIYERAATVLISPGATYGPLTARGAWNLFRLGASDPQQARAAAEYLAKAYPARPIGLVNDRTTFGRNLADGVAARLRELGQREAVSEAFDRGSPDLTAVVRRLAEAQVAAVYFGGLAPEAVSLVRAMRHAKLDATLVASDGILDPAFAALGAAGDGTVMTMAPEPPHLPEPPGAKALVRTPEANAVAASAYAAVQVFAQAIDRDPVIDPRNGRADGRKLAQTLRSGSWKTVLGPVGFDKQGDQSGGAVVLRVWRSLSDGRFDFAGQEVPAGLRPATGGPALN